LFKDVPTLEQQVQHSAV